MKKLVIEEVRNKSKEKGFIFLDEKYIDSKFKHNFKCIIDNEIHKSRFNDINNGHGLICCKKRKDSIQTKNRIIGSSNSAVNRKLSLDYIKEVSLRNGYEFLDSFYFNCDYRHNFKCLIHKEIHTGTFYNISNKKKLICCKKIMKGENHPSWNPRLTDKERKEKRTNPGDIKWRKLIKERDNYICQICSISEKLHAHHLFSYASNKDLRYDLNNGITLCILHHNLFHHEYGKFNNTKEQYLEFKNKYKKEK